MINSSNLGWFHGNRQLDMQFIAIAQLRAAETGLPIVVASNTGTSVLLSPKGYILAHTRLGEAAILTPQ